MISRWAGPVIAVTFLTSILVAGHGMVPVAYLFIVATLFLTPYALIGWISIALLLCSAILSGRVATIVVATGSAMSFLAWLWLLYDAEWGTTIVFSAHYLAAMFYFLVYRPVVYETVE